MIASIDPQDAARQAIVARLRTLAPAALANLERLAGAQAG